MLSGTPLERPAFQQEQRDYQSPPWSNPSAEHDISAESMHAQVGGSDDRPTTRARPLQAALENSERLEFQFSDRSTFPQRAAHEERAMRSLTDDGTTNDLKLPENAWLLLEYYFAYTHSWLPMTERPAMLKLLYAYPAEGLSQREAASAEYAELWSIMALSATQMCRFKESIDGERCRTIARGLIPFEHDTFALGHVKALLVIGLFEMTNEKWQPAWLLIGCAVRLLTYWVSAASHRVGNTIHQIQDDRFSHVRLAAFVLETALAVHLGASAHMQPEQISVVGLVNEDGLDEWAPWHDPLAGTASTFPKSPARSSSTLNRLVHIASTQSAVKQLNLGAQPEGLNNVVLRLVENARSQRIRLQPAQLDGPHEGLCRFRRRAVEAGGSFESETGENPSIPHAGKDFYRNFGSEGTFSVGDMTLTRHAPGVEKSWTNEPEEGKVEVGEGVPFDEQVDHFVRVMPGCEKPRCSGEDGLRAVVVCDAVKRALEYGEPVNIGSSTS